MKRTEQVRKEILLQLYGSRPIALSAERIERDARKQGYGFTAFEIERELQFLMDEELIAQVELKGSAIRLFRILSAGVKQFEGNYIA